MTDIAKRILSSALPAALFLSGCSEAPGEEISRAVVPEQAASLEPIAIEFFTSQGCSSCPPADEIAVELADDPAYVVISRPVTYWDRLGWRDTLAREENTELQRAYASRLRYGGERAYTPQAVVNGQFGLVGSRRGRLEEAIGDARDEQEDIVIAVGPAGEGGDRAIIIEGTADVPATISLVALDASETVSVGAGENGGRRLTYANIVISERVIGHWDGQGISLMVGRDTLSEAGADRHAIIVRRGTAGPILAARYLETVSRERG